MPVESKTKIIEGRTVTVTQFPALLALNLQTRLIQILGESFITIEMADETSLSARIELAVISLCNKIQPEVLQALFLELLQCTRVAGTMKVAGVSQKYNVEINTEGFETAFAGNLLFMYKVLAYVLEVNFGDFLALGDIAKNYGAMFLNTILKTGTPTKSSGSLKASSRASEAAPVSGASSESA